jgi:hypothetical protein
MKWGFCPRNFKHTEVLGAKIQGLYKLPGISLRHDLRRKCRNIVKFLSITHRKRDIWNGPLSISPQSVTSHKTCLRGFGGNGSIAWTFAVSHGGRISNAFKVTMKLQTFLFQMVFMFSIYENMVLQNPPIIYTHHVCWEYIKSDPINIYIYIYPY